MSSLSMIGTTGDGRQVLLLKEGTTQTRGRAALTNNIAAAKIVASMLKTVLGPRGMDKMLVDSMGGVTITNDGATILKEMDIQHPAAKMMVEIAKAVDNEAGDGTTSSVIIAGALLEKAEELIKQGIHPTIIVDGYRKAMRQALDILNKIAEDVKLDSNHAVLKNIAKTSMESKIVSVDNDALSDLAVEAILAIAETVSQLEGFNDVGLAAVDLDNVKIQKKPGGAMSDSSLIKGIIIDKEITRSEMPRTIKDAKILLMNTALEIEKTEYDAKITIEKPGQMQMFLDEEGRMLKSMADKIAGVQANIVFCQKGIDDVVLEYLTRANIAAVEC
jgi:chaperonin GroEL (HSP60 family)